MSEFSPEWQALGREAQLSAELLGSGITSLGRANYAQKGYYNLAFFNISIGIERLGKLIYISDYAISENGVFPTDDNLIKIGHSIIRLIEKCDEISKRYPFEDEIITPISDSIHKSIIQNLDDFARITRYYNLDMIVGGRNSSAAEPVNAWWTNVGDPILNRHYTKKQRARDEENASMMGALLGTHSSVLHFREDGSLMNDIQSASQLIGATKIVQKYGRFYVLQIVRWMAGLLRKLSHIGAYQMRIEPLLGLNEPFALYYNADDYLLSRKTWSIYRP